MKKRVLFFTTSGNYNGGGVMCLIETLKYIDREKIEPFVVIPNHGSTEEKLKELNIQYDIIRCYDWLYPESIIKSLSFKIKFPMRWFMNVLAEVRFFFLFKRRKIEAFHLNSVYNSCGTKAAKRLNIPIYWHLREFVDENPWTSVFIDEKKSYRQMEAVHQQIAVSSCIKEFYQEKMPNAKIEVVYDGVDFSGLRTIRNEVRYSKPLRLSMVGGVTEVKGHEDAIRSVYELKKNNIDCHLSIYGRSRNIKYQAQLNNLIQKLNIQDIVSFEGNKSNMNEVWDNTDIVLVTSKSESFGRVAVEAMYQNIPVIGADNSSTSELINDDTIGLLYNTGDPKDLCNKLIHLINQSFTGEQFNRNHERALSFGADNNARAITKLLLK